jgi:hypothetical protein
MIRFHNIKNIGIFAPNESGTEFSDNSVWQICRQQQYFLYLTKSFRLRFFYLKI